MPSRSPVTVAAIVNRFQPFFGEAIGDFSQNVSGVNSPESASASEMIFLATPKAFSQGLSSKARVWIVSEKNKEEAFSKAEGRTVLVSPNPEKAMALVISAFFRMTPYTNPSVTGVHPSAIVSPDAQLAKTARIAPHAFIGAGVVLGENTYIGANAVIEDFSIIGEESVIHPNVFIGHHTEIGARCEVHPSSVIAKEGFGYAHDEKFNHTRIPHQGKVVLEDDVHIGACCTIDRATFGETRIQRGAILDNIIHVAHNCVIGRNAIATSGFTMAGSSKVGANFVTGGKSVISGHVTVPDNVQLSALSAVAKSLTAPGQYGGHPLQPMQSYLRSQAALVHLPQMRKLLKKIAEQLGFKDEAADL